MASSTTKPITIRLNNQDIEALEVIRELGGFASRGDCLRALLEPTLIQARTAIETKSVAQAGFAKVKAEVKLNRYILKMANQAEKDTQLPLPELEVSLA